MNYAKLLKQKREREGISQEKAAEMLHVSQSTYSRLERGMITPTSELIKIIDKYCKLPDEGMKSNLNCTSSMIEQEIQSKPAKKKINKEMALISQLNCMVYILLIAFSISVPMSSWLAIYWAYRSHYCKWVIVLTAIFALFLSFYYLDQIFLITPTRTGYSIN